MSRERPILMSGPLVRAVLEGRKTQTRRPIASVAGLGKVTEVGRSSTVGYDFAMRDRRKRWNEFTYATLLKRCPFGAPGDRLWVRETFAVLTGAGHRIVYRADGEPQQQFYPGEPITGVKWTPSIFMRRHQSRLSLVITDVRVERIQSISEEDAIAEGAVQGPHTDHPRWHMDPDVAALGRDHCLGTARWAFANAWNSLYGPDAWDANPWVWALTFEREGGAP